MRKYTSYRCLKIAAFSSTQLHFTFMVSSRQLEEVNIPLRCWCFQEHINWGSLSCCVVVLLHVEVAINHKVLAPNVIQSFINRTSKV